MRPTITENVTKCYLGKCYVLYLGKIERERESSRDARKQAGKQIKRQRKRKTQLSEENMIVEC